MLGWIFRALMKVASVVTPWNPWLILAFFVVVTMVYTMTGGLSAVIMTDCLQYVMITLSAIVFAGYAVAHVGGLAQMMSRVEALYPGKHYLDFCPGFSGGQVMPWSAFFVYLFIQWWAKKFSDGGGKHHSTDERRPERNALGHRHLRLFDPLCPIHLADHPCGLVRARRLWPAARSRNSATRA